MSQAVEIAAGALDAIPQLTVLGEVTGFRGPNARSGHCYFQIKDDSAAVDCIIWKGAYLKRTFDLRDGMQVSFKGSFNLYKATGRMSFVARSFSLAGEGLLRQKVAQLAEKLRREGLMDESRKRRIPVFCSRVAVVTSLSGAVIDDVKRTLRRRNPLVELVCVGAKVQGEGAPAELIDGLRRAASITPAPDCILLVRGGGSFEDLMTFNDEELARAVAACPVPVVTGIGHEPDTSICDMVSDRRASTPTAAAESVAPAMTELADVLEARHQRLGAAMASMIGSAQVDLEMLDQRGRRAWDTYTARLGDALDAAACRPCLNDPTFMVERRESELALTADRLSGAIVRSVGTFRSNFERLPERLITSTSGLDGKRHALTLASSRLEHQGRTMLSKPASDLSRAAASLDALSPLKVLARGYSIAYSDDGVATSAKTFKPGDAIRVRMADGNVAATVDTVE
ncbi:exodeoxyribonuclease VII large subunit [Collinsella aerofaciens]|nr:exodeoxyribonuclease VII large subunit [Collinsella aerofaciens]MZJ70413.1 exodeoxyribonuclease VII large subunit [Collinsella aerofaciens]